MKNYYRAVVVSFLFSLLLGCQSFTGGNFFSLGPSDERLVQMVSRSLASNPELAPLPIQVAVSQGTVSLSGYVRTIRQSDTAGDIASKVAGVRLVENNLIVRKY